MIMLFRRFRDVSFMSKAVAIWAEADERIAELDALAAAIACAHRGRRHAARERSNRSWRASTTSTGA